MNNIKIDKKEILKSNNLIESSYKLTIAENRIIDLALTKLEIEMLNNNISAEEVKALIKKREFNEIEINVVDYLKEYNITNNSIYNDMAMTVDKLYERSIIYIEGDNIVKKRWVITCKYNEDNSSIALQFHPDLIPDLMLFKSCYTKFDFDVKKYIKSYYACRIYELLKQYQSYGVRTFDIDQLRFLLGIEDTEYPFYGNLRQRVINPSIEQINEKTDLYCELEEIRNKRTVVKIRIKFKQQKVNYSKESQLNIFENTDEDEIELFNTSYNVVNDFKNLLGITISPKQIEKLISTSADAIKKYNRNISIKDYIIEKKLIVDSYSSKTEVKSYLGALMKAISNNWEVINKITNNSNFTNYAQRTYDYNSLERKILDAQEETENDKLEQIAIDMEH